MNRPTKEQVDDALEHADLNPPPISDPWRMGTPPVNVLAAEVRALRTENAELLRQVAAARSALQQCTHERVDPNRDPFGGF